jgi:hypothetical protein
MYTSMFNKAQADLKRFGQNAGAEAEALANRLGAAQRGMMVAGTVTAISSMIAPKYMQMVADAGAMLTAISDVMLSAGDNAGISAQEVSEAMDSIQLAFGFKAEETAAAMKDIGGRTGDWVGTLKAVPTVAALAAAKGASMASVMAILTTAVMRGKDELGDNVSLMDQYKMRANQLLPVLEAMGSGWSGMGTFMETGGAKLMAANQSLQTTFAIMKALGPEGVSSRALMGLQTLPDKMQELKEKGGWKEIFPTTEDAKGTMDIVRMIGDVDAYMQKTGRNTPAKQMDWVTAVFGSGSNDVVMMLLKRVEVLKEAKKQQEGWREGLMQGDLVESRAAERMGTYAGEMARLNGAMGHLKETLGVGVVPLVIKLMRALNDLIGVVDKNPWLKTVLGVGAAGVGGAAVLGTVAGPAAGIWYLWSLKKTLGAIAKGLAAKELPNLPTAVPPVAEGAARTGGGFWGKVLSGGKAAGRVVGGISTRGTIISLLANPTTIGQEWAGGKAPWNKPGFTTGSVTINLNMNGTGNSAADARKIAQLVWPELAALAERDTLR